MDTTQIIHYAQTVGLELSHFIWGLIAVVLFFVRSELSKINKFMEKSTSTLENHGTRITKIETKLDKE